MKKQLLASIIISSYNYGRFRKDCIDSALKQAYPHTEVIVVDDASTDDSQEIMAGYGDRIIPVLREKNEGAKSTCNAARRLRPRLGGRIYSPSVSAPRPLRRIFHGVWGSALFQSVYQPAPGYPRAPRL